MRKHYVGFEVLCLALGLALVLLAGCAGTTPTITRTAFQACMDEVGKNFVYTSDRIRAADWCKANNNGEQR